MRAVLSRLRLPPDRMALRAAIEQIIREALQRPSSPPWATVEQLRKVQLQTKQLRESLAKLGPPRCLNLQNAGTTVAYKTLQKVPAALEAISRLIGEMMEWSPTQRDLVPMRAYDSQRAFLISDLNDLWTGELGGHDKGRVNFLNACLEPVFGPERGGAKAIKGGSSDCAVKGLGSITNNNRRPKHPLENSVRLGKNSC